MKRSKIELFREKDGFYAARKLKGGKLSADAHKVTAEEIMTMFTEFFQDYCRESKEDKLVMKDGDGHLFVTMMVPVKEETGEAKE